MPPQAPPSFGFESIPESDKQSRVGQVFTSVAPSYDTMNDLMSLTIHRLWKDHFVRSLNPGSRTHPQKILDIASGTGDIALRMLAHATDINNDRATHRHRLRHQPRNAGLRPKKTQRDDPVRASGPTLLPRSRRRRSIVRRDPLVLDRPLHRRLRHPELHPQDASAAGAFRVLKPGGVFACLEFSKVRNPLLNAVYKRWSFGAIPLIGQLVAGDRESYQYLVESIERFPTKRSSGG